MLRFPLSLLLSLIGGTATFLIPLPASSQATCGCEVKTSRISDPDPRTGKPGVYFDCVRRDGQTFTQWANIWYYNNGTVGGYRHGEMPKSCVAKDLMNLSGEQSVDELAKRIDSLKNILGYNRKSGLVQALSGDLSAFSGYSLKTYDLGSALPSRLSKSEQEYMVNAFNEFNKLYPDHKTKQYFVEFHSPTGNTFGFLGICGTKIGISGLPVFQDGPRAYFADGISNESIRSEQANSLFLAFYYLTVDSKAACPYQWTSDTIPQLEKMLNEELTRQGMK